jgi:hypothetical protein
LRGFSRLYGGNTGDRAEKLLVPTIRDMIDSLVESKNPDYGIDGETRALLLRVSPAAADRLLKKARKADEIRGISTTRAAQSSLRAHVPVRTHSEDGYTRLFRV